MRVLQLWLTLPKAERWTKPDHQFIRRGEALVYSGSSGTLVSATRNRVPVTLVDVRLEPGGDVTQLVPASYNGFVYVLEGEARIGPDERPLLPGQVGWLERPAGAADTTLPASARTRPSPGTGRSSAIRAPTSRARSSAIRRELFSGFELTLTPSVL
jgi:quercetin 2,3-dioxygenase